TLAVALAYAWVSYPFTLFALESNSNVTLVAVFILAALLFASSPPVRGVFAALAGLTKFAPLALAPVLATHGLFTEPAEARTALQPDDPADVEESVEHENPSSLRRRRDARTRARALASFLLAFALT